MNDTPRFSQRFTCSRLLPRGLLVLFATIALVCHAASDAEPRYAAGIQTLAGITTEIGKYVHPKSAFFQSPCVQDELRRILGRDFNPYRRHLMLAGGGTLERDGDFICGEVSQDHVGGYESLLYVDPKKERMYLFWLKSTVAEGQYEIYGDRPIPPAILTSIARRLNSSWGHVASFRFTGEHLIIESKQPKFRPDM